MSKWIVGGVFDKNGGRSSKFIEKMGEAFSEYSVLNGGHLHELEDFNVKECSVLVWFADISNDVKGKFVSNLKKINPKMVLVISKRVDGRVDFKDSDFIGRMLNVHAVLGLMIDKTSTGVVNRVLDPLGNEYCNTMDTDVVFNALKSRLDFLSGSIRVNSNFGEVATMGAKPSEGFIGVVKELSVKFSQFADQVNPARLFGNASTRCSYGFPAERGEAVMFVSPRNVNKSELSAECMVPCTLTDKGIVYESGVKPSVDAPIQVELFKKLPNIRYIVHGHCYIDGAATTANKVPCGDLREVEEVMDIVDSTSDKIVVNLKGHGCLIMGYDYEWFTQVPLAARPFPEK